MTILVTGCAGHLGEASVRTPRDLGRPVRGFDRLHSPFTDVVGSINDVPLVAETMREIDAVLHVATLHEPHVTTHSSQAFIDANVSGTESEKAGWKMAPHFDRVYDDPHARTLLGWEPKHDFRAVASSGEVLAQSVGKKGYHR